MTKAQDLKIGDVIMPPAREVRLWMRRDLQGRNLPSQPCISLSQASKRARLTHAGAGCSLPPIMPRSGCKAAPILPSDLRRVPETSWTKIAP